MLGALTLLAGCATAPPQPLPALKHVPNAFELSARLAIRQGEHNEIARLRWTRRHNADVWILATPLGNEVARIESGPQGAVLHRGGEPSEEAPSFEALTERILGVGIDPAKLAAWLHGQPVPANVAAQWRVTVDESRQAGALTIARRMTATSGEVMVRLFVDDYRTLEE